MNVLKQLFDEQGFITRLLISAIAVLGTMGLAYYIGLFTWKGIAFACSCVVVLGLIVLAIAQVEYETRETLHGYWISFKHWSFELFAKGLEKAKADIEREKQQQNAG